MILHSQFNLALQFRIKIKIKITITIKIIEMFELHTSMAEGFTSEYLATIPIKFLIIMHNHAIV